MKNKLALKLILALVGLIPFIAGAMEKPNFQPNKEALRKAAQDKRLALGQRMAPIYRNRVAPSPLFLAAMQNDIPAAQKLLDSGADINEVNDLGQTPLIASISALHPDMAIFLINRGADVNKRDIEGFSALTRAAGGGFENKEKGIELVRKLIAASSNINNRSELGTTPLIAAVVRHQPEIVQILLEEGADTSIANEEGDTAYDLAGNNPWDALNIRPLLEPYQKRKLQ